MSIASLIDELLHKSREYYKNFGDTPYPEEDYRTFFETFVNIPTESDFADLVARTSTSRATLSYGGDAGTDPSDPLGGGTVNVNNTLLDIDSVADELDEWRGVAASSFRDNVKTPFPGVVQNMFLAASVIHGAATAEQALWRQVAHDVENILEAAINAVESLDDCNPDEFVAVVAVAGAVLAVPFAGPGGAAIAAAVTGVATTLDKGKSFNTGSGEPMVILGNTRTALNQVIADVEDGEDKIREALNAVTGWMTGTPEDYQLGRRPGLADGPGGITGLK